MNTCCKIFVLLLTGFLFSTDISAQLSITGGYSANALVQRLVGSGVQVSNISFHGRDAMAAYFDDAGGANTGIDSGIVLTNGRAKSSFGPTNIYGLDGNGLTPASNSLAHTQWGAPGDADLSLIVGDVTNDACVLEFDFIPLGDSIRFNYVFSSEEYTLYACTEFNDAFAFLISGPGIAGTKNLALIPGTNLPVTINNINNHACSLYPQYYVDNLTNPNFTHDGHIKMFTALEQVQPCQTYHLKLVIADVADDDLDSGVFLEAGSLSSNAVSLNSSTQIDGQNNNYLVEGCVNGSLKIKRPRPEPTPLSVSLTYSGTAINGVDIQTLPSNVIIPANQSQVTLNLVPIIDNIPEGIEFLKIYALGGCSSTPADSAIIQIRDYDTLGVVPDTAMICKNSSIQLQATAGQNTYLWDTDPTLSNINIRNPIATPVNHATMYYCTSTTGTCHGRDSAYIVVKDLEFVSKTEINCKNDATGEIRVAAGPEWTHPIQFSINNSPWQPDSTFSNLPVGVYRVRIKDAVGCMDSMDIAITQLYPDFLINNIAITPATCTGTNDGTATITLSGGKPPYLYSIDGINFLDQPVFHLLQGNYTISVIDNNRCPASQNIVIPLFNHITLDAGPDLTICEGTSIRLQSSSNADTYDWYPANRLDDSHLKSPVASPVSNTLYKVFAHSGICTRTDSMMIFVNPAPTADAGPDATICYGQDIRLQGSGGTSFFWYPYSFLDDVHLASPMAKQLSGSIRYYLNVIDNKGCYSLKRDSVFITVNRPAEVFAGRDTVVAIGQPLPLFATDVNHTGFTIFEWYPATGLNNANIQNPLLIPDKDITYMVTARTPVGCMAKDQVKIKVYKGPEIYVPNVFTPNNDGLNDVLKAIPAGIRDFHYFRIYDRWGKQVFMTTNASVGWNGRITANDVATGNYVWVAEGTDYLGNLVQRKGTVIILR